MKCSLYVVFVQKMNQELEDTIDEKEALKTQVQQYILEVRRIEDVLNAKVCSLFVVGCCCHVYCLLLVSCLLSLNKSGPLSGIVRCISLGAYCRVNVVTSQINYIINLKCKIIYLSCWHY